ncbi:MAG: hypothetical protein ACK5MT_10890 [Actinomycetales bacterium]
MSINTIRYAEDVTVGERLPQVDLPLTVYRLVMAAGANRDFNSIHHNTEYARSTGAPEMYANTSLLMSSWERCVRDWAGPTAQFDSIRGFRMKAFNTVGTTLSVHGEVTSCELGQDDARVSIRVWCESAGRVSVGPGTVSLRLPRREQAGPG